MKNLNFTKPGSLFFLATLVSMLIFTSCGEDEEIVLDPADYTVLEATLSEAEGLINSTTEGEDVLQYEVGSKVELQKVIGIAQVVMATCHTTATSPQSGVDNTVVALQAAIDLYQTKLITPIDPATLVGHWKFDEGSGTTTADVSGNGFDGTFNNGNATFGEGVPAWAEDRKGVAGKAVAFDKGAWIEVPYNTALNPEAITVSVWVNHAVLGGRFMGLHSWNGYKFEVPDHGKPFFTASTEGKIWDNDAGTPIAADYWYHLVVTYGAGEMVFYIDGVEVKRETNGESNNMVTVTDHNLAIGVDSSKYADNADNYDNDKIIPVAWGNFYNGRLDELRIYNTVLTAPQARGIYNSEK